MDVAIVGSRTGFTKDYVFNILNSYNKKIETVISGGAMGVDTFAEEWANLNNKKFIKIRPEDASVKSDYIKRNIYIIHNSDLVIAFWDGISRGTKFVIDYCNKHNFKIIIKNGKE